MKNAGEIQIASRYVSALFDVAKAASVLGPVEKDLRDLALAAKENTQFASFIDNPLLNRAQQSKIIEALADSMKVNAQTKAFLITLASQRRLGLLPEIAAQFAAKAEQDRGEMSAEVISAYPLSSEEVKEVAEHLGKAYGKKINLTVSHDKKLLGGIVVKIGGMQLDSSVAGKLDRLNQALKAA